MANGEQPRVIRGLFLQPPTHVETGHESTLVGPQNPLALK